MFVVLFLFVCLPFLPFLSLKERRERGKKGDILLANIANIEGEDDFKDEGSRTAHEKIGKPCQSD